ncbi:MAG: TIGR02584 family CRISPR-associated protein, partial [Candidatus Competibacteraceae bacterium]|nr:TIGR02584 family CRISPR-associated protein [Candidatus Competibacteraceae bacterium]
GMSREFLDPKKAKINDALRDALGPASASDYQIQDLGKLPGTRYKLHGLALQPEQVRFGAVDYNGK